MVGKSLLSIIFALSLILIIQPNFLCDAETRAFEKYDMDNLPPQDVNGNFTLDEDDEWTITGSGILRGNITMYDESILVIENANVTINGTIWAKDKSQILISSSILNLDIPSPDPVLIEKQYDDPNGFLLIEDEASIAIDDSNLYLFRYDVEQTVPDGMMIPIEVLVSFGEFTLSNSYINTEGILSLGFFNVSVIRGIVLHMNCEFEIINSNMTSGIVFYVNAHGSIQNTQFRSISAQKNTKETDVFISNSTIMKTVTIDVVSKVVFENCDLKSCLIVKDRSEAHIVNTSIDGLQLHGNATVVMDDSDFLTEPIYPNWNHIKENSRLILSNSSFVQKLLFFDETSILLFNSSMNITILTNNATLTLKGSNIINLTADENSSMWLQNSNILRYNLNDDAKICNVTTIAVSTKLNLLPFQILVELKDQFGNSLASQKTNEKGLVEFSLVRDMIRLNGSDIQFKPQTTFCFISAQYENLHKDQGVNIQGDHVGARLDFEDYNPPFMNDVRYEVDAFIKTHEDVPVSVRVLDNETNLANVTLKYSVNDGSTWKEIALYNTGGDIYENSIPGHSDGTKVRFYIIAEDKCGNTAESRYFTYTVGEDAVFVNNLIIITSFVLVLAVFVWLIIRVIVNKRRIGRYIKKGEK